jgi:hypothetical protein
MPLLRRMKLPPYNLTCSIIHSFLRIMKIYHYYYIITALLRWYAVCFIQSSDRIKSNMRREASFSDYPQIPAWLSDRCSDIGFKEPNIVQESSLPLVFEGKDIILQSQTGELHATSTLTSTTSPLSLSLIRMVLSLYREWKDLSVRFTNTCRH